MEPKYLWTIKWTQPYNGNNQYMQNLWDMYERLIEQRLEEPGGCAQAKQAIERIMKL